MANVYGRVQVRRLRGQLVVMGMGKTARGTSFIRKTVPIQAKSVKDPNFKSALAAAVSTLFSESDA